MAGPILWIDGADPGTAVQLAGAKMGRLTELLGAGAAVPRGFSVTVDAYRKHCAGSGLDGRIDAILAPLAGPAGLAAPDPDAVSAASRAVRTIVEETAPDPELAAAISSAYRELGRRCGADDVPVAVRSSAAGEDAHDASFAGVFDTYLGISGADGVLAAVRSCWASLFTERALAYRLRHGRSHREMPIAVGVVELVPAHASGVAFSVHPVTGRPDRIVVEGSWGWGEAVVQGRVTPDHIELDKADGRVLRYDVAAKTVLSTLDPTAGRVVETDMPVELVNRRVLDDEELAAVFATVREIEAHYGHPVDVEWVLSRRRRPGEQVTVVQARPVTVASPAPPLRWDPVELAMRYTLLPLPPPPPPRDHANPG